MKDEVHLLPKLILEINDAKDFQSAIEVALKKICKITGWNYGDAWIKSKEGSVLEKIPAGYCSSGSPVKFKELSKKFRFPLGTGVPGRTWLSKKHEWVPDVSIVSEIDFPRAKIAREAGFRACLGVPIIANDEVLAVLTFLMFESRDEEMRLVDFISVAAAQLGSVIQRKKAEEEIRKLNAQLERRVVERTAELVTANEELKAEMMERKRIEETLRENQDLLQAIIHGTNDAIFVKDRECRVIMANPATLRIIGKTAQEVIGKKDTEIYTDPEIGLSTMENDCRIMESGNSEIVEEIIEGPHGKQIFLSTKCPRIDADGRIIGIIGVACDITERKRAENELRKTHDESELRVQERTAQLKDSLKEKEILLREIHHRVKNNMQIISGLLMLQEEFSNDEKFIEMIKESQNRIVSMALVHEKLYRSESLAKIDFKEYIDALVSGLFESYGITENRIGLKVDAENISMGIDAAIPCGLIINELISNSLKHAFPEEKKGEIEISLSSMGEDIIEISVQDNGIGIPDDLDFRNTQSLGLHIVNLLVEDLLQEEITLDKERGTEFRIRFGGINVKRK